MRKLVIVGTYRVTTWVVTLLFVYSSLCDMRGLEVLKTLQNIGFYILGIIMIFMLYTLPWLVALVLIAGTALYFYIESVVKAYLKQRKGKINGKR